MSNINLAPHEALKLREMMTSNLIIIKKLNVDISLTRNEELKSIMKRCVNTKKRNLSYMHNFINSIVNSSQGGSQ